jgi:hypothetical protein
MIRHRKIEGEGRAMISLSVSLAKKVQLEMTAKKLGIGISELISKAIEYYLKKVLQK